jgi:hypothetical protein
MDMSLKERLKISEDRLQELNDFFLAPDNPIVDGLLDVVSQYGAPDEINWKAAEARRLSTLMDRLGEIQSPYLSDLDWLAEQREQSAFISLPAYRQKVLGARAGDVTFDDRFAVTLEISALQYFPWLIAEARCFCQAKK